MSNISSIEKSYVLPSRAVILCRLEDLISENCSCVEVADWASQFIRGDYDHLQVEDWPSWEMLSTLAGADIKDSPKTYLYTKEDFEDWASELKCAPPAPKEIEKENP